MSHWSRLDARALVRYHGLSYRQEIPEVDPVVSALIAELIYVLVNLCYMGWSGGAMVLGQVPVPGRSTIWMIVGQRPIELAVGASGGCLDIFTFLYPFSPISPSLWETARYRLKYCLKRPFNTKQPTNQPMLCAISVSTKR